MRRSEKRGGWRGGCAADRRSGESREQSNPEGGRSDPLRCVSVATGVQRIGDFDLKNYQRHAIRIRENLRRGRRKRARGEGNKTGAGCRGTCARIQPRVQPDAELGEKRRRQGPETHARHKGTEVMQNQAAATEPRTPARTQPEGRARGSPSGAAGTRREAPAAPSPTVDPSLALRASVPAESGAERVDSRAIRRMQNQGQRLPSRLGSLATSATDPEPRGASKKTKAFLLGSLSLCGCFPVLLVPWPLAPGSYFCFPFVFPLCSLCLCGCSL